MEEEFDLYGFEIPRESTESQIKYLQGQPNDPDEFARRKHAESAWNKLSTVFNEGKCTLDQLYAEIRLMRQSVIMNGIPHSVRAQAYLLLANITEFQVHEQKEIYEEYVQNFFALSSKNTVRKDIKQVGIHPLFFLEFLEINIIF